jgi:ribose 5-phosphate isomerase B
MKIALGNDHPGYPTKKEVIDVLKSLGVEVIDFSSYGPEKVDFPDITRKVCDAVRKGQRDRGIMVCGTRLLQKEKDGL